LQWSAFQVVAQVVGTVIGVVTTASATNHGVTGAKTL
jgi:hypothetical protein